MMSKDTIYREDAIKAINLRARIPHDVASAQYASMAISAIYSVPSADRPQGEWIDAEIPLESGGSMPIQVCNLCKTFYPLAYTGGGHRFCPNCGADMRERKESEDE
jgi:hypothetical protein